MPTYEVADSKTGKVLELTGDSPPTEQELNDIFSKFSNSVNQPGALGKFERGIGKAMELKPGRHDLLPMAKERFSRVLNSSNDLEAVKNAGLTGLLGLGVMGQRMEAGVANPALILQQELNPNIPSQGNSRLEAFKNILGKAGQSSLAGLMGKDLGEVGDVYRSSGVNETASKLLGLQGAFALDPTNSMGFLKKLSPALRVRQGRKILESGVDKLAKATGNKFRQVAFNIQHLPESVQNFLAATKFKSASKEFLKDDAPLKFANEVNDHAAKYVYEGANEAYDKIAKKAPDLPVAEMNKLIDDLTVLKEEAVASGAEISKIDTAIRKISGAPASQEIQSSNIVDYLGRSFGFVKEKPAQVITLRDVLEAQRDLRLSARKSVLDAKAAGIIGKHLTGQFNELAEANTKWAEWANTRRALDSVFGKETIVGAGESVRKAPLKIVNALTPRSEELPKNIEYIDSILKKNSKNVISDFAVRAKHISAGANIKKTMGPHIISSFLAGSYTGNQLAGPIGGAIGGGMGTVLSSPKLFSQASKMGVDISDFGRNIAKSPLGAVLKLGREGGEQTLDQALLKAIQQRRKNE